MLKDVLMEYENIYEIEFNQKKNEGSIALIYAWEAWSMSRADENMTSIYERKILRLIFGGIQENGTWRRRSNFELYQSYNASDIVNFIKIQRIKCTGHVVRMNEDSPTKSLQCSTIGTRRKGSPNIR
ncbi:UNVERIFIED_CONTAM: hypothetical protein NCL1_19545 [Trichonephila clavipes]